VVKAVVPAPTPTPVKTAGGAGAKKAVPAVVAEDWTPPALAGAVKTWSFKGKTYLRNAENEIWLKTASGEVGEWQGVYIPTEDRIDDSVEEPVYEEDDE
jgi:hypothetical protein